MKSIAYHCYLLDGRVSYGQFSTRNSLIYIDFWMSSGPTIFYVSGIMGIILSWNYSTSIMLHYPGRLVKHFLKKDSPKKILSFY